MEGKMKKIANTSALILTVLTVLSISALAIFYDLRERIEERLEQQCRNCQGRGWWSDGTGPNYTCSSCNGTGKIKKDKSDNTK